MRIILIASFGMHKACCHDFVGSTWGFSASSHDSDGVKCEATNNLTLTKVPDTVLT